MFSARKAKTSMSVTPGSLLLKFVHSGLWTGMRASASSRRSWYLRSSMVGIVKGILSAPRSPGQRHVQTHALAHLRRNQLVDDGGDRALRVLRVLLDLHRLDRDARLPLRQRLPDAVFYQVAGGDVVRLEEE